MPLRRAAWVLVGFKLQTFFGACRLKLILSKIPAVIREFSWFYKKIFLLYDLGRNGFLQFYDTCDKSYVCFANMEVSDASLWILFFVVTIF